MDDATGITTVCAVVSAVASAIACITAWRAASINRKLISHQLDPFIVVRLNQLSSNSQTHVICIENIGGSPAFAVMAEVRADCDDESAIELAAFVKNFLRSPIPCVHSKSVLASLPVADRIVAGLLSTKSGVIVTPSFAKSASSTAKREKCRDSFVGLGLPQGTLLGPPGWEREAKDIVQDIVRELKTISHSQREVSATLKQLGQHLGKDS